MTHVGHIQFRPAGPADRVAGVRGFVSCVLVRRWRVELVLRRTLCGMWTVAVLAALPARLSGQIRPGVGPMADPEARP